MGAHLIDGDFKSDKYPTCPVGKVPLSTADASAQDLLAEYARRRRPVDAEFSDDLEHALKLHGYRHEAVTPVIVFGRLWAARDALDGMRDVGLAGSSREASRELSQALAALLDVMPEADRETAVRLYGEP